MQTNFASEPCRMDLAYAHLMASMRRRNGSDGSSAIAVLGDEVSFWRLVERPDR
jgi:hypothetical protein